MQWYYLLNSCWDGAKNTNVDKLFFDLKTKQLVYQHQHKFLVLGLSCNDFFYFRLEKKEFQEKFL